MLGMAGLPIYIHAPKFFVESYGISLSALCVALFALRLLDLVQDPLLGRLAERTLNLRSLPIWVAAVVMGLGMFGLFSMDAPFLPILLRKWVRSEEAAGGFHGKCGSPDKYCQ